MTLQGFFIPGPHDDGDAVTGHYYEMASSDRSRPQVWAYTNALSYAPGEEVVLHATSTAGAARVKVSVTGRSA